MTKMPLSFSTESASTVVGPLAPSAMIFALISDAFLEVMTPPTAAGMRISQSSVNSSSLVTDSTSGRFSRLPFSSTHSCTLGMSRPCSL